MTIAQYNVYDGISAVRLVSTSNLVAVYINGPSNDGIGATLTLPSAGVLTIDSTAVDYANRIILVGQTNTYENGIYILTTAANASSVGVLTRTADFQSASQMLPGQYIPVGAGALYAGSIYTLVEPLPNIIGVDAITFHLSSPAVALGTAALKAASDNTQPNLSSVKGAITSGHIASFADTAGTVQDGGVLGQAAAKAVSDNTKASVASVSAATVLNHMLVAADITGTIKDSGAKIIAGTGGSAGGTPFFTITATGMTGSSIATANFQSLTTDAAITRVVPGTNTLTIFVAPDPGTCSVAYIATTAALT